MPPWGCRSNVYQYHTRGTPSLPFTSKAQSDCLYPLRFLRFRSPKHLPSIDLDQVLDLPGPPPWLRRKCLTALCHICGRQALLPKSLQIPLCYNRLEVPRYRGGFADVWIGDYQGQRVAAKVLRVYTTSDLDKIRRVRWFRIILSVLSLTMVPSRGSAKKY